MLMNNIGDPIHEQVVDAEIIPIFVKIVKKKVIIFFSNQRLLCYFLLPMLIFPYSLWYFSLLAVRFACQGANISPTRCNTNISWWSFWKVSTVL
jgi:hypothetical protein